MLLLNQFVKDFVIQRHRLDRGIPIFVFFCEALQRTSCPLKHSWIIPVGLSGWCNVPACSVSSLSAYSSGLGVSPCNSRFNILITLSEANEAIVIALLTRMFFSLSCSMRSFDYFWLSPWCCYHNVRLFFTFFEIIVKWVFVIILYFDFLSRRVTIYIYHFQFFSLWRKHWYCWMHRSSITARWHWQIILEGIIHRYTLWESTLLYASLRYYIDSCAFLFLCTINEPTYTRWIIIFIKFMEVIVHFCFFDMFQIFSPRIIKPLHLIEILTLFYVSFKLLDLLHLMYIPLLGIYHLVFLFCLRFAKVYQLWSIFDKSIIQSYFLS